MKNELKVGVIVALGIAAAACSKIAEQTVGVKVNPQDSTVTAAQKPGAQFSGIVYPGWYKELPVPWLPQVPPGDWANTKNCGQACALMVHAYFNWYCPGPSGITNANRWLASRFGDSRYLSSNGWYTNFSGRNVLGVLIVEYFRKAYLVRYGSSYDDISQILAEIQNGKPVIVGVMISGGRLVSSGGIAHWSLAVGYDQGTGEIILNDPGTNSGNKVHYKFATFDASWRTQGRIFVPVW